MPQLSAKRECFLKIHNFSLQVTGLELVNWNSYPILRANDLQQKTERIRQIVLIMKIQIIHKDNETLVK